MIEIVCLIYLWWKIGQIAETKGLRPGRYRAITMGLWFGLEIMGSIVGHVAGTILFGSANAMFFAYALGIIGALTGMQIAFRIVRNAQGSGSTQPFPPYFQKTGEEILQIPAEITIYTEPAEENSQPTDFFLNSQWICRLPGGCRYQFRTFFVRNRVTAGMADPGQETEENTVKFIASDGGDIRIFADRGKLEREKFSNMKNRSQDAEKEGI